MLRSSLHRLTIATALFAAAMPAISAGLDADLAPVLNGSWRSDANKARDAVRHPLQTLEFFGVKPTSTVIELVPGGGNPWYAEILAPLLAARGQYIGATIDPDKIGDARSAAYEKRTADGLKARFAALPEQFGKARLVAFDIARPNFGPAGSADVVLTFRNVHNWVEEKQTGAMFKAAFDVLKPGGVFGVVDHRAVAGKPLDAVFKSGYLPVEYVIDEAKAAGFVLQGQSEVNANAKDTKDHPRGVWTLPPVLAMKDVDRAKYVAIGESDRFTLKFVKPAK